MLNNILKVKKLSEDAILPSYAHEGDAGLDLYALEDVTISFWGDFTKIRTGISVAIPRGYYGQIASKSGLAANRAFTAGAGVIDSGYRSEIIVLLKYNCTKVISDHSLYIKKGTKVAQLLILPVLSAEIREVEELDSTERGSGGFGSTGA